MVELANASTGLTFGQLLRGDSVEAKKQIERLLSPRCQTVSVVSAAGNTPATNCLELENLWRIRLRGIRPHGFRGCTKCYAQDPVLEAVTDAEGV